jgi:sulfoxide reductase heme-binding subunit YedZ
MTTKTPGKQVWRMPWTDRAGRFSWLKAVTFALILLPGICIEVTWTTVGWGPRPVNASSTRSADGRRFLLLALAVTPARRVSIGPG